jgi:prevent-host-death family protein
MVLEKGMQRQSRRCRDIQQTRHRMKARAGCVLILALQRCKLVIMTTSDSKNAASRGSSSARTDRTKRRDTSTGRWLLRDAKARLSEVIKRVHRDGPQRVTVRGEREVVIIGADEYRRLKGGQSGQELIDALAASPLRDVDFERARYEAPVRDVEL